MKDLIKPTIDELSMLYENKQAVIGIPSGFTKLDEMTSGWQNSDLIIIAARPSMGKTDFWAKKRPINIFERAYLLYTMLLHTSMDSERFFKICRLCQNIMSTALCLPCKLLYTRRVNQNRFFPVC